MRLVDGHQAHLQPAGSGLKNLRCQTLGSQIDQFVAPRLNIRPPLINYSGRQGAVDERGGYTSSRQAIYLILHQGNEGRNDQGDAIKQQGW